MTLHMTPEQVVVTIRRYPWFFLGGFVTFIIGLFTGSHVTIERVLAKVPDIEPEPHDRIPSRNAAPQLAGMAGFARR
jgi:hypothetical protein